MLNQRRCNTCGYWDNFTGLNIGECTNVSKGMPGKDISQREHGIGYDVINYHVPEPIVQIITGYNFGCVNWKSDGNMDIIKEKGGCPSRETSLTLS